MNRVVKRLSRVVDAPITADDMELGLPAPSGVVGHIQIGFPHPLGRLHVEVESVLGVVVCDIHSRFGVVIFVAFWGCRDDAVFVVGSLLGYFVANAAVVLTELPQL